MPWQLKSPGASRNIPLLEQSFVETEEAALASRGGGFFAVSQVVLEKKRLVSTVEKKEGE